MVFLGLRDVRVGPVVRFAGTLCQPQLLKVPHSDSGWQVLALVPGTSIVPTQPMQLSKKVVAFDVHSFNLNNTLRSFGKVGVGAIAQ
jgi:hypothetical protein